MKVRKVVSFLCSMAVMASSFVGIITANAESADSTEAISLVYNKAKSTSKTADIDVYAKGFTSLSSFCVALVAEDATIEKVEYTANVTGYTANDSLTADDNGVVMIGGYISGDDEIVVTETTPILNVTVTFTEDLESDAIITLADDTELASTAADKTLAIYDSTMTNVRLTVLADPTAADPTDPDPTPTAAPAYTKTKPIPLSKLISFEDKAEKAEAISDQETTGTDTIVYKFVYIKVEATKQDDEPAEYGVDYVAVKGDTELSYREFDKLMNPKAYAEQDLEVATDELESDVEYALDELDDTIDSVTFRAGEGVKISVNAGYEKAVNGVTDDDNYYFFDDTTSETGEVDTVTYTVTFRDEDGDEIDVIEGIEKNSKLTSSQIPDVPEKDGYTAKWVIKGTTTEFTTSTKVTKDLIVEPKYTKKNTNKDSSGSSSSGTGTGSSKSMIASSGSTGTTGSGVVAGTAGFTDIDTVPWAVTAIKSLAGAGIINGTSATTFEPLTPVTRAQFAKMVCASFGITGLTPAAPTFTDVAPSDWYYSYVEAAAAAGIVNGVSATAFDPNALITREQMAAMIYRAITLNNITLKTGAPAAFTDASAIGAYAVDAVNALSAATVINGMDDGRFAPQETATRAQAACIIYQYFLARAN